MGSKPRILVVDDEVENTEYVRRALRHSYDVKFAPNGVEALQLVKQYEFAVILSDIKMLSLIHI